MKLPPVKMNRIQGHVLLDNLFAILERYLEQCKWCRKSFVPYKKQRMCSKECERDAARSKAKETKRLKREKSKKEKTCEDLDS